MELSNRADLEENMGGCSISLDEKVEGRPAVIKVYDSDDDETEDGEPVVRVTTVPIGDGASALEQDERRL